MDNLEDKVQRLLDIEEIKQLKAKYCWCVDDPSKYDEFADLFAPDGKFIEPPHLEFAGREAIAGWMKNDYEPEVAWSRHFAVAPLIEIDGDTATGRWQGLLLSITKKDDGSEDMLWAAGTYEETYRRVDGTWLFDTVTAAGRWMTDFSEGFVDR